METISAAIDQPKRSAGNPSTTRSLHPDHSLALIPMVIIHDYSSEELMWIRLSMVVDSMGLTYRLLSKEMLKILWSVIENSSGG